MSDTTLMNKLTNQNSALMDRVRMLETHIKESRASLERLQDTRHHEVLCLVLGKAIKTAHPSTFELAVEHARRVADLAYPPPTSARPEPSDCTVSISPISGDVDAYALNPSRSP